MSKYLFTLIIILPFNCACFSQVNNDKTQLKRNSLYIEFGGNTGSYSINYDLIFYQKNNFKMAGRVGFAIIPTNTIPSIYPISLQSSRYVFLWISNIAFWHRNLGRGKGFAINGFKSNHYPDFIVVTKSGNTLLIETKGDDRDNTDSLAKCRLGNKWAELSGREFSYFMIFEKNAVAGSYTVDKAKELIKQL